MFDDMTIVLHESFPPGRILLAYPEEIGYRLALMGFSPSDKIPPAAMRLAMEGAAVEIVKIEKPS